MIAVMCTVVTVVLTFVGFIGGVIIGIKICIDAAKNQTVVKWKGKDIFFTVKEYDPDED